MKELECLKIVDEMANGYKKSWMLFTAIEVGLFDALRATPISLKELAKSLSASSHRLKALLDLLVFHEILTSTDQKHYQMHPDWLDLTDPRREDNLQARLIHTVKTARSWSRASESLLLDLPVSKLPPPKPKGSDHTKAFHKSLGVNGHAAMSELVKSLKLKSGDKILDIGGGFGDLCRSLLASFPKTYATVFETPETAELAKAHIKSIGLDKRISFIGGDFLKDEIAGEYDFILLSNILHIYNKKQCITLLTKLRKACSNHGKLFVRELLIFDDHKGPLSGLFFSMHMALNTDNGQAYSKEEIMDMLEQSGWTDIKTIKETSENRVALLAIKQTVIL